ncbi:MtrB/PioB family decaheme-associated outer membrane protein [Vibrio sp. SS-MA-C1-2]|uniref:MtrB/PioB family decaheme-associated outer membrane protein n=1 Tax=Vibrio sp. SS-MA-C1-2 TaxID=2908646 RepID=UPI001F3E5C16|nr:MtrB/PioB family decaheme-associated outer membrane protein [Vibrio sp. SS-MA-C1-2]UJF18690.1 MtrB/PioB family decaheme-associated outer membrane protein [Vibrio sp. SS-MA-C1-2]
MRLQLNLITFAMLSFSSVTMANYNLADANLSKVNTDKWKCKRCKVETGLQGEVGVSGGLVSTTDDYAANQFNGNTDGGVYAVDGDLLYRQKSGHYAKLEMDSLGSGNGAVTAKITEDHGIAVTAGYKKLSTWSNDNAESSYSLEDDTFANRGDNQSQDIKLTREKVFFNIESKVSIFDTFVNLKQEQKNGTQTSSYWGGVSDTVNVITPVDSTTSSVETGIAYSEKNWHLGASYIYSEFEQNLPQALYLNGGGNSKSTAPDNHASHVVVNGNYRWDATVVSAKASFGRLIQDQDLLSNANAQSFDGEVNTTDLAVRLSTRLTNKLRVTGKYNFNDRDNDSTVKGVDPDASYQRYNQRRSTAEIDAYYRFNSDYRLKGQYRYQHTDRDDQDRDVTEENSGEVSLRITAIDDLKITPKVGYQYRGGSDYHSGGDNIEQYYLADRERYFAALDLGYQLTDTVTTDLSGKYNRDNYDNVKYGLQHNTDYRYDLTINWLPKETLTVYSMVGQQWIKAEESTSPASQDIDTDIKDDFIFATVGVKQSELLNKKLTIGADYSYAHSSSKTDFALSAYDDYDHYDAYSHNLTLYGEYQFTAKLTMRFDYQYENYDDSNDSHSDAPGLIEIENLDHDYDAHFVLLGLSYKL